MAALQRSVDTFRRIGSSGMVWDDRFFSGDLNRMKEKEEEIDSRQLRPSQSVGTIGMMERRQSSGGRVFHRTGLISPAIDPPSPKVSACGCCGMFGKPRLSKNSKADKR